MSYYCVCEPSKAKTATKDCATCMSFCNSDYSCVQDESFSGITLIQFTILFIIQMLLFVIMLVVSIVCLRQHSFRPRWFLYTVTGLLLLWLLIGWFPGVGLVLWITLIGVLIYGSKKKGSMKK